MVKTRFERSTGRVAGRTLSRHLSPLAYMALVHVTFFFEYVRTARCAIMPSYMRVTRHGDGGGGGGGATELQVPN